MNMIEKVARAMDAAADAYLADWRVRCEKDPTLIPYIGLADVPMKVLARAAIDAMREPTGRMIDAVAGEEQKRGYFASESLDCCDAWPIMIDAALSEDVTSPTSSVVSA